MEECGRRGIICGAPVARRIRGMGERAERRSECCLLFSYAGCIRSLCARSVDNALYGGGAPLRGGTHGQANAGKRPDRPSPSGLLATTSF
jgi:hypothetical protein